MLEEGKISIRQATLLMVNTVLPTAILFLPAISTRQALQDAWISTLIATTNGVLIALLVITLMRRFPEQTLVQYSEDIMGKFIGKIIGLGYIWWFLHINAIIVREFGDFMVDVFMPRTPLLVFNAMIVLLAVMAVKSGLEPLGRLNEWIFILNSFILIMIFTFSIPEVRLENLQPVLERGIVPVLRGAYTPTMWFGEIIILGMIFPFITQPQRGYRIALAHLITGAFLLAGAVITLGIFGPELLSRFKFPITEVVRLISLGDFLERIEIILAVLWISGVFVKVSIFHYVTVMAAAQWFNLRDYRPLALPLGILNVVLSIHLFEGVADLVEFLSVTIAVYSLSTFEVGIPALLLLIAIILGKGGKNGDSIQ